MHAESIASREFPGTTCTALSTHSYPLSQHTAPFNATDCMLCTDSGKSAPEFGILRALSMRAAQRAISVEPSPHVDAPFRFRCCAS